MENTLLIWLGIFVAVIVGGTEENNRPWIRWIGFFLVGLMMIVFYR